MLRQLARLTLPVADGRKGMAIAVYGNDHDEPIPAADTGFEGVACVDDVGRAVVLLCDVLREAPSPVLERWMSEMVEFVLAMQLDDGRFVNFIADWAGTPNTTGLTSRADAGQFWQARGVEALAKVWQLRQDERVGVALDKGFEQLVMSKPDGSDGRSVQMLAAFATIDVPRRSDLRQIISGWADEIASCRKGDVLTNYEGEQGRPHLWGHIQEGVLARAGQILGRRDLIDIAERSADVVLRPVVESGFDVPQSIAYDVASVIYSLDELERVTGKAQYKELAALARQWFTGRNSARCVTYDRQKGRVCDGLDGTLVNPRSGAESNIMAAIALLPDVIADVRAGRMDVTLPAAATPRPLSSLQA